MRGKSLILIMAFAVAIFSCNKKPAQREEVESLVPVSVFVVKKKLLKRVETIYGNSKGFTEIDVYPKVGGKVTSIKVKEWDRVKKGDVIVVVDRDLTGLKYEPYFVESPISGIIGHIYVELGEEVTPPTMSRSMGTPIARVVEINPILIECDVPERLVYFIKPGQKVEVRVLMDSTRTFEGKVYRSDAVVNPVTRSAKAQVIVKNPDYILRPGMYAEVNVILDEKEELALHRDAIMKTEDGSEFVWIVNNEGVVEKRFLKTDIVEGINVGVVEGLKEGDRVIMLGKELVKEGMKVNVRREEG